MVLLFSNVVEHAFGTRIGLHAFPRFMFIDNNGGANSHAPCVVGVSQPLRSLRQALTCKRVLVHVRERIHDPPPP